MKRLMLIFAGLLISSVFVYAADESFVYNDRGKRDPFSPLITPNGAVISYDSDLTVAELNLEGVMMDPKGNSVAIINGKILKIGDSLGPYIVQTITNDFVELLKETEIFTLKIKKGGN